MSRFFVSALIFFSLSVSSFFHTQAGDTEFKVKDLEDKEYDEIKTKLDRFDSNKKQNKDIAHTLRSLNDKPIDEKTFMAHLLRDAISLPFDEKIQKTTTKDAKELLENILTMAKREEVKKEDTLDLGKKDKNGRNLLMEAIRAADPLEGIYNLPIGEEIQRVASSKKYLQDRKKHATSLLKSFFELYENREGEFLCKELKDDNKFGSNCFMWLVRNNFYDLVKKSLAKCPELITSSNKKGSNAAIWAARYIFDKDDSKKMLILLADRGAALDATSKLNRTMSSGLAIHGQNSLISEMSEEYSFDATVSDACRIDINASTGDAKAASSLKGLLDDLQKKSSDKNDDTPITEDDITSDLAENPPKFLLLRKFLTSKNKTEDLASLKKTLESKKSSSPSYQIALHLLTQREKILTAKPVQKAEEKKEKEKDIKTTSSPNKTADFPHDKEDDDFEKLKEILKKEIDKTESTNILINHRFDNDTKEKLKAAFKEKTLFFQNPKQKETADTHKITLEGHDDLIAKFAPPIAED